MTKIADLTPLELLTDQIEEVWKGYVQGMLWANAQCVVEDCADREAGGDCEHTNGANGRFEVEDVKNTGEARTDVENMVLENLADFREYLELRAVDANDGSVASHFGHDFALTRNGHGAGFWDRGLGELGDRLSKAADVYGSAYVDVTTDDATFES